MDPDQKTQDLEFFVKLNSMLIHGESLWNIQQYVSQVTRDLFFSNGGTIYVISDDKKSMSMAHVDLLPKLLEPLEKLIGMKIPTVTIPLTATSTYSSLLSIGHSQIINDPATITNLAKDCTSDPVLQALIPAIMKLLDIHSVMMVPLMYNEVPIGLLEISRSTPFTNEELHRFEAIASQIRSILVKKKGDDLLLAQKQQLEKMNSLMVGRELMMAQLKKDNARLQQEVEELKKTVNGSI
jgi:hypothetical protein